MKNSKKTDCLQLSIDSSTYRSLLCVSRGEKILLEWEGKEGPYHGEQLLKGIDKILKDCSLELKDLDFLSVGIGPGTFTGLRIGVSSAKCLAEASGLALLGIPSLQAQMLLMEEWEPEGNPRIWSLTDARRNEVYVLSRRYKDLLENRFLKSGGEYAMAPEELAKNLEPGDVLLGDGLKNYKEYWPKTICLPPEESSVLRPCHVAKLGYRKFLEEGALDSIRVNPIYLRTEKF